MGIIEILLWGLIPIVIVSGIQFLCCRFIKNKYLRHTGLFFCVVSLICAIHAYSTDSGLFIGGNIIAALSWLFIAVLCFVGYGVAWVLYRQYRKKHI